MRHILIIFILAAVFYGDVYGIYPARVGKRSASDSPPPEDEFPFGLKKKFNARVPNLGNDDLDEGLLNRGYQNYGGQYPGFKRHPTSRQSGRHPNLRSDSSASQPDCNIPGNCPDTDLEFNTYSKNVVNVRPGYDRRRSQQGSNQYDHFGSNQLFNLLPPPEDEFPLGLNAKLGQQRRRHKYLPSKDTDLLKSNAALLKSNPDLFELIVFATKPGEEHYNAAKQIIHDIMELQVEQYAARFKVIQGRDEQEIYKRGVEFILTKLVEFLNTHGNEFGKWWATTSKEW